MKKYLLIAAAFAAGTTLGLVVRPMSVAAQNIQRANVSIEEVQVNSSSAMRLHGNEVLGFSCIADQTGNPHCFAITR
jgi:hypothetical protein